MRRQYPFRFKMTPLNTTALLQESSALLDLGLGEEAVAIIERLLSEGPDREVHSMALCVFNRLGRFARACISADALLEDEVARTDEEIFNIALAFNFSGRIREAYELEKSLAPQSNDGSLVRLYGLACKATRLGHYEEALGHMLSCFGFHNVESWDAHRKIFLDYELSPLWERIPSLGITLRHAMRFCNIPFDDILRQNEPVEPLRCVDHMDFHAMPAEFRTLLQPVYHTCFEVNPRAEALNPRLYSEYARWQENQVAPRIEIFRALRDRIRGMVVNQQLHFAAFQSSRGRIACSRNHLVCHLLQTPDTTPHDLPDIPALRPLLAELRAQYEECPTSFRYLIAWGCREEPEAFIRDIHPEMPECNRNSGYALLALGCMHYRLGDTAAAIEAWSACAAKWPLDDAPVMNATMLLSGEQRWDEASRLMSNLPGECMESTLWKRANHAIRERRTFTISSQVHTTPIVPTPTFGNLYSGADEEFLLEQTMKTGAAS